MQYVETKYRFNTTLFLEVFGSILGIVGAVLMALNPSEYASIAFPVWLLSSITLTVFAFLSELKYLMYLQLTFVVVNMIGIYTNVIL